ncbi:MAG: DUF2079 domain-containing protein [bacterium]|nr:MAG: DUF2079 domain-containing protein [bacterium]
MKIKKPKFAYHAWISPFMLTSMITTYTLIIGTWSANRYMSFNATIWDLGIMTQAIWNTAHGRILHESVNLGFSASRLAVAHWELIYLPLAVIYRIIPSTPLLLYIQSFILAFGVIPIYKFARQKLSSETTALLIASAYLFYPALHGSNLFDLHGLTFATTFLLFTFCYLDQENVRKTILFAILSICCREDVAFVIFMLGLYGWIVKKNKKIAILLLTLNITWLMAFFTRAYFTGHTELMETTSMAPNCEHLGIHHVFNFFHSPFKKIIITFQFLLSCDNIKYLAKLILPVVGLCCLSPAILFIAAPTLLLNLSSNWHHMHQIEYHYTATITPFIFLATIKGMANLKRWLNRFTKFKTNKIPLLLGSLILVSSVVSTVQFSILRFHTAWCVAENHKKLAKQLHEIPPELSVSTTARPGAHLANRKKLYHFPEHFSKADIIIIELNRAEVEVKNIAGKLQTIRVPAMNEFAQSVFPDTTLGLRFVEDNVFCFQRGLDARASFKSYAFHDEMPSDAIKMKKIEMGNGLYFLGWKPVYIGNSQAHFQLFWFTNKQQNRDVQLNFFFKSGDRKIKIPHKPLFGKIPIDEWNVGKTICDHIFINRPKNIKADAFSVLASISVAANDQEQQLLTFKFP